MRRYVAPNQVWGMIPKRGKVEELFLVVREDTNPGTWLCLNLATGAQAVLIIPKHQGRYKKLRKVSS